MEVKVDVSLDNIKQCAKKFGALKNEKHLQLLLYLEMNSDLSLNDIHMFSRKNNLFINRQSTHKALDILVKSGFVCKLYDEKENKIVYRLKL